MNVLKSEKGKADITTILGFVVGIGGILLGMILEGGHASSLMQLAAFIIVLFGTAGAVMVSSKQSDITQSFKLFKEAFQVSDNSKEEKTIREIVELAKLAKKESLLAIENEIPKLSDKFTRSVMKTAIDGVDAPTLKTIFDKQIELEEEKLMASAKVWSDAGGFSPTIGIIGAVLGLIHVMGNLTDTSKLGSGIAVAFVATVYGVGFANLVFLPISNKIKKQIFEHRRKREMAVEGGLCLLQGLSSGITEMKLRAYLEQTSR